MNIELPDPQTLCLHPGKPKVIQWDDDDPRYLALCDDVGERGVTQPISLVGDQIIDGELRWRAAKRMGLKTVPAIQIPPGQALIWMAQSLAQRKHYPTKSALAYVLYPIFASSFTDAKERQQLSLKKGTENLNVSRSIEIRLRDTIGQIATKLGFSRALFFQAQRLYNLMVARPDLRAQFECKILLGDMDLGAAISGMVALQEMKPDHGGGVPKNPLKQLDLFNEAADTELRRWSYWRNFNEESRAAHFAHIKEQAEKLSTEGELTAQDCKAISAYHTKVAAEFAKVAKDLEAK